MSDPFLGLAMGIVKAACKVWLKDHEFAAEASGSVVDLVQSRVTDVREQRRLKRLFEQFEERIADQFVDALSAEFATVPENERTAAVLAASDVLDRARLLDEDVFAADLDPLYLERNLRRDEESFVRDLSPNALPIYERILSEGSAYIIEVAATLPQFQTGAFRAILQRQEALLTAIDTLTERIPRTTPGDPDADFEVAYRRQVVNRLDRIELFGATLSAGVHRYPLSVAYISLSALNERPQIQRHEQPVRPEQRREPLPGSDEPSELPLALSILKSHGSIFDLWPKLSPDESWAAAIYFSYVNSIGFEESAFDAEEVPVSLADSGAVHRVDDVLAGATRLFFRGEAGSGKTTLLQWLAVRSAKRDFAQRLWEWNDLVPFFIPLRKFVGQELPPPEAMVLHVGRHIADEMPSGWVHRILRDGRALVLVDGIDELPEDERTNAKDWLETLTTEYPYARYVVTSRPAAAGADWLRREDFGAASLQTMGWTDIKEFIEHWHRACGADLEGTPEERDLVVHQNSLLAAIRARRHLRQLATNPLLCALMCALYFDRRMQLPHDRMELYRVALEMLLERRERERGSLAGRHLSKTDQIILLQDLAYWLIRNGWSDAPTDRVVERLGKRLEFMPRSLGDPAEVLDTLLLRSGVIREPVAGRIDFIHRTFEEYLAAKAAIEADDMGLLVEQAHNDQWREVVIMAAGHAQPRQRTELFRLLLARAEGDETSARTLRLLAVACFETSAELEPPIRDRIQSMAAELLPPNDVDDAESLAMAGDFVIDLLTVRTIETPRQAAAVVRTASLIGGEAAVRVIGDVAARYSDTMVSAELLLAWRSFDPDEYAENVLRHASGVTEVSLDDPTRVRAIRHLNALTSVKWRLHKGSGDLSGIAEIHGLTALDVEMDPQLTDLSPLASHPGLEVLRLNETGTCDLTPLASMPRLKVLDLNAGAAKDIKVLHQLREVQALTLRGLRRSPSGNMLPRSPLTVLRLAQCSGFTDLQQLANCDQLKDLEGLELLERVGLRSLAGIEKWSRTLTTLTLGDAVVRDLFRIAALRNLVFLDLGRFPANLDLLAPTLPVKILRVATQPDVNSLEGVARLPGLTQLIITGSGLLDLSPFTGVTGLTIHVSPQHEVRGDHALGEGSSVMGRL
ncbi:hypothetical protein Aph01nite_67730 [Acrocarpospora phusangensis]|uniref:NACHT domain-containing protein n=1 Tax=Acrocarpospora phusangensis TaxID=1070424 RepID=A0A919QGN7_9ACTN|nr:NACHT domain-containing protein [Acrocarpospora phusangensis]GIH28463.1 hypothetical protein Aph01nite_67730 [Acrocarpospora phusangensis]